MTVSKVILKLHILSIKLEKMNEPTFARECSNFSDSLQSELKEFVGVQFLGETPKGDPYFTSKNIQACKIDRENNRIITVYMTSELFRYMDNLNVSEALKELL